jgi:hypothetical protein
MVLPPNSSPEQNEVETPFSSDGGDYYAAGTHKVVVPITRQICAVFLYAFRLVGGSFIVQKKRFLFLELF